LAIVAGIGVFAYFYGAFMWDTWQATEKPPKPPKLDPDDIKIATALAGVLGGVFAVALGVERQQQKRDTAATDQPPPAAKSLATVGKTLTASDRFLTAVPATLAVWVYFLTGVAAAITWQFNKPVAPAVVKTLAEVIGGYVLALITALAAQSD